MVVAMPEGSSSDPSCNDGLREGRLDTKDDAAARISWLGISCFGWFAPGFARVGCRMLLRFVVSVRLSIECGLVVPGTRRTSLC